MAVKGPRILATGTALGGGDAGATIDAVSLELKKALQFFDQ